MLVPTTYARCWGWTIDGRDCKQRADGSVCFACARFFQLDPK
jgi:hypothetical protein